MGNISYDFGGRTVVVTGAAQGIGLALSTFLDAAGAGTFRVAVNAISPNAPTRMVDSIPEAKRAEIASGIPMGRFAAPAEMCASAGFLASEEAGYVTGIVLPVDGGVSI